MCGTTPTHTFTIPFSVADIKNVRIAYAQGDEVKLVKEISDCQLEGNTVVVKLTQEDTLSFDPKKRVEVQMKVLTHGDDTLVSTIKSVSVGRCLDEEVIK